MIVRLDAIGYVSAQMRTSTGSSRCERCQKRRRIASREADHDQRRLEPRQLADTMWVNRGALVEPSEEEEADVEVIAIVGPECTGPFGLGEDAQSVETPLAYLPLSSQRAGSDTG